MGNKGAVLWDMDGVLVDSSDLHFQSWMETLARLSIPFDREKFDSTFGMNNYSILTILLGKPPEPEFLTMVNDRKESLFREMIPRRLQLFPGALSWLKRLWEAGILQAIASSAQYENIVAVVDELDIRQYFSVMISAYFIPGKPDPAVILEAARQLEVEPRDCVVVEDSVAGVTAARIAGMRCFAITTTHPRSSLTMADVIVDSLEELTPIDFNLPV